MFAEGTLTTSYSGPTYATGESLYRPRNESRALAGLLGNDRAYRVQGRGVGAGSRMAQYQAGMQADQASQDQYAAATKADLSAMADRPESRFAYQKNVADEQRSLRSLLLDGDKMKQAYNLAARGDTIDTALQASKLRAEKYAAEQQRRGSFLSSILGIF